MAGVGVPASELLAEVNENAVLTRIYVPGASESALASLALTLRNFWRAAPVHSHSVSCFLMGSLDDVMYSDFSFPERRELACELSLHLSLSLSLSWLCSWRCCTPASRLALLSSPFAHCSCLCPIRAAALFRLLV